MSDDPTTTTTEPNPSTTTTSPVEPPAEPSTLLTEPEDVFDPDKLTLPEGFELNEQFDEFKNFAKEAGFKGSQVQKMVEFHHAAIKAVQESTTKYWNETHAGWVDEIKKDSELGPRLDEVKQTVSKLLDNPELSDPKFREALNFTGAGNHPAVVRTLYRWAQRLSEGGTVAGDPAARRPNGALNDQRPSPAQAIYGPDGPFSGGPKL